MAPSRPSFGAEADTGESRAPTIPAPARTDDIVRTMSLPTPALEMRVPIVDDVGVLQGDSVPRILRSREVMHSLHCSTAEHGIVPYIDGVRTVAEVANLSGLPQVSYWTALVGLIQKGIVGIDG